MLGTNFIDLGLQRGGDFARRLIGDDRNALIQL